MDDLNCYELLDLDPDVDDGSVIEKRLQEKQRLWSRQATEGTPRDARLAARNLKLLDAMRRTLADPKARKEAASEARRRREQRLRESRAKLSELLEFARGKVEDVEAFVARDCARYVRELGKAEVMRLIAAAGIRAEPERPAPPLRRETLEPTTAKRIRDGLEHLGKADLYAFLGLSRRCSVRSLRERAEQINRTLLQSGRSDDQTGAGKELAGQCMAIFASDEGKERYNNTLTEERLEAVLRDFLPLAGQKGIIGRKEMTALLGIAGRRGIAASEAAAYIRTVARRRKWLVADEGEEIADPEVPVCGYCGCLAQAASDSFCWNCKHKLTVTCPRCGRDLPSSRKTCTECGADIEDAEIVETAFREARRLLETHDVDGALKQVNRCLSLWPDWAEAVSLKERIEEKGRRRQAAARQLVTLLRERRMVAAQDCLEQARLEAGEGAYDRASDVVTRALADANRFYREGERFRRDGDAHEAARCYEQALSLCTDLEPALERLRELPPVPPANLDAQPAGHAAVRLVWKPGRADAVFRYTVTRKADGIPSRPDDGDVVVEDTPATVWEDTNVPGGVAWHYAAFSLRQGVSSAQGAVAGPVFLTPPVTDVKALSDDGRIRLEWSAPEGAPGVEVRRREGAPPESPDDGEAISALRESAQDTGLVNGKTYFYTVTAVYADPERPGIRRCSPSVLCRAVPAPHLDPITDLRCLVLDSTAYLRWTPPEIGRADILRVAADVAHNPDSGDVEGDPVAADAPGSAVCPLPDNRSACFFPRTCLGNTAVYGPLCRGIPLCDVRDIRGEAENGHLLLTWTWPELVEEVLIRWSGEAYPTGPDCPRSAQALCTLESYRIRNGFAIPTPTPQRRYVCVYAKISGRDVCSPGARYFTAMGLADTVRYRVEKPGLLRREARRIELRSSSLEGLHGVQVRGMEDRVPLTADEGLLLTSVPLLRFRSGVAHIEIPPRFRKSRLLIRLFLDNPELAQCVRLMPAHTDELKLW